MAEAGLGSAGAWPWPHVGGGEGQHHLKKHSPTEKRAAGRDRGDWKGAQSASGLPAWSAHVQTRVENDY